MLSRQHDLGFMLLQNNMFSSVINTVKSYYNIIKISDFIQQQLMLTVYIHKYRIKKISAFCSFCWLSS